MCGFEQDLRAFAKEWKNTASWEKWILIGTLLVIGTLGLFCAKVNAAPFLTADPQQNVTAYEVQRDIKDLAGNVTTITEQSAPEAVAGGVRLRFDMFGLPVGTHAMRVIAVRIENREGGATYARSDPAPFVYECASQASPPGLRLSME